MVSRRLTPVRAALTAALLALVALVSAGCGTDRPVTVSVFPLPGSQVASPKAQIAFRGLPVEKLGRVRVTGSRSGVHTGRMLGDSDGNGGSFMPNRSFTPGELVTVKTQLHLIGGRRNFTFTIAHPAGSLPDNPLPFAGRTPGDVLSVRSRPDLRPAVVKILRPAPDPEEGDVFVAPQEGPVQNGPMILDPSGHLIWFHPLPSGRSAADFRVQTYHGRRVLTWWQGYTGAGVGIGEDVIFDSSYKQIAQVHAANGLAADLHEFQLTPDGHALITAYYPVYWDESPVHGPRRGIVLDAVVQEIDIKTGLLLFQWDSLDHVPVRDTYEALPQLSGRPFDYFHVNSIQLDHSGDLVISARNTWAAYRVDPRQGHVIWTVGGRHSTFKLPEEATFAFQHHVRVSDDDDGKITVFDDGAGPPRVHGQSRGLLLKLDLEAHRVTLVREEKHSPPILAAFEGSLQTLPNGDRFLGWGQQPYFTEFDPSGRMVFDGRFISAVGNYRAYRFPWTGRPTTRPAILASNSSTGTTVYVSWNGATKVASWEVLTGTSPTSLRPAGSVARNGFETAIAITRAPYVAVRALDAHRRTLATSATVAPS
jgi:hypothetical protein